MLSLFLLYHISRLFATMPYITILWSLPMKTLFRVTIAVILTLTLANTNCVGVPNAVGDATAQAGSSSTTTGGSNTTTAAQLAAALNAMNCRPRRHVHHVQRYDYGQWQQ